MTLPVVRSDALLDNTGYLVRLGDGCRVDLKLADGSRHTLTVPR